MDWLIECAAFAFFTLLSNSWLYNRLDSEWSCSQMVLQSSEKTFFNLSFLSQVIWWLTLANSLIASMAFTKRPFELITSFFYCLPNINWKYLPLQLLSWRLHSPFIITFVVMMNVFIFNYFFVQCRDTKMWAILSNQIFVLQFFNHLFIPSLSFPKFCYCSG